MAFATRPSNVRVYQFRHFGTCLIRWSVYFFGAGAVFPDDGCAGTGAAG